MAKGNPFMGMARGKVGDIVLTRGGGQQITRARNRNPRNPKTQAQMYQRAIMASVVLMYKAGQSIFDHAFQGKSVGLENMKAFMSINAKKLRKAVIDDLQNNTKTAHVVSPSSITPSFFAYRVSEGTMSPGAVQVVNNNGNQQAIQIKAEGTDNVADVFIPGDIYTLIAMTVATPSSDKLISPAVNFGYIRLKVKETLPEGTVATKTFADVFEVDSFNAENITGTLLTSGVSAWNVVGGENPNDVNALAVIRSREDKDLRSTADMSVLIANNVTVGVAATDIPEAWSAAGVRLGQSDLVLEGGGDFDPTPVEEADPNP